MFAAQMNFLQSYIVPVLKWALYLSLLAVLILTTYTKSPIPRLLITSLNNSTTHHLDVTATSHQSHVRANASGILVLNSSLPRLLHELKSAVRAAGGVPGDELSKQKFVEWENKNPCNARRKLPLLYNSKAGQNLWKVFFSTYNSTWHHHSLNGAKDNYLTPLDTILKEYENLHRICTRRAGNLTQFFLSRNVDGHACKFLVVEFGYYGLGNRLLWLISAFAYSLLTQRILLIDTSHTVDKLLCQPFPGSSWSLPRDFPYFKTDQSFWKTSREFLDLSQTGVPQISSNDGLDTRNKTVTASSSPNSEFYAVRGNAGWNPEGRFFCDKEQTYFNGVTWLSFSQGCLYFLPGLFAIPSFKPVLEWLFPERAPLTPLLRYLVVPVDSIWRRLQKAASLGQVDRVLGLQVRYKDGSPMYSRLNQQVNMNILRCGLKNGLLKEEDDEEQNHTGSVGVFIASLHRGTLEFLSRHFNRSKTVRQVVQLSSYEHEIPDRENDEQALAEIMGLSFSDAIITTPVSTFGYIAQAYGGLKPWIMDLNTGDREVESEGCLRGQSVDACYQSPIDRRECVWRGKDQQQLLFTEVVGYLRRCQDDKLGLQLVISKDFT